MPDFVNIEPTPDGYQIQWSGRSYPALLGKDVTVKGYDYTLGELTERLAAYQLADFDERAQLDLGQYLYAQLAGAQPPAAWTRGGEKKAVALRIVSPDEHIRRLPWALLAREGEFLAASGWSIAFAPRDTPTDCRLPELPRILLVMPQAKNWLDTKAADHLAALEKMLGQVRVKEQPVYVLDKYLCLARDWEGFKQALAEFVPHIIYFYGHGKGNQDASRLIFADDQGRELQKPVADLADVLRQYKDKDIIKLVYLNCCSGDTGGSLGAGGQLAGFIPAVVSNITLAQIDAAQAQGAAFLKSVVLDGLAPDRAVAELRRNLSGKDLSFADARWFTPVLHCHYRDWHYQPPRNLGTHGETQRHIRLDRTRQFGFLLGETLDMLQDRQPRALCYAWYGRHGQGILKFHQRIALELGRKFERQVTFYTLNTHWPSHFAGADPFSDMLTEPLNAMRLSQVPARLREKSGGSSGRALLVYVQHQLVTSPQFFGSQQLKQYLEWWDRQRDLFADPSIFYILGLPFVVGNPQGFHDAMAKVKRETGLQSLRFALLDELTGVTVDDLIHYFEIFHPNVGHRQRIDAAERIIKQTAGHFENTIEHLLNPQFYVARSDYVAGVEDWGS